MKVLIIDDFDYKLNEAKYAAMEKGLLNIDIAQCAKEGIIKAKENSYDLIISDLGLPIFPKTDVENPLEGLDMLIGLAIRRIKIPTIIFSTTDIPNTSIEYLTDLEYPYLGQAKNIGDLTNLIDKFLIENSPNTPRERKIKGEE